MRTFFRLAVCLVILGTLGGNVFAWEFDLNGEYEFRFRYFARTGDLDLFGNAALQESIPFALGYSTTGPFIGFAGPSIYGTGNLASVPSDSANSINPAINYVTIMANPFGVQVPQAAGMRITRGGFSRFGSDAFYNDSRLTLRPRIRINRAVRIDAVYTIGGMRNKYKQNNVADFMTGDPATQTNRGMAGTFGHGNAPLERYYMSGTSVNAYDGTFGTWEQYRLTLNMPWGVWSMGLKDFPFGTGATLGENTRGGDFLWMVPYGPFRFLSSLWLARGRNHNSWATVPDGDTKFRWYLGAGLTYDNGPLSMGALSIWRQYHEKRGALPVVAAMQSTSLPGGLIGFDYYNQAANLVPPTTDNGLLGDQAALDESTLINVVYMKYNNGRFFGNAEYSWANQDTTFPTNDYDGTILQKPPVNVEASHFFCEGGVLAGPAKLSLAAAWASGPVLINPALLQNNPAAYPAQKVYAAYPINYQALEPYEFLMFNTYAGGNNGGWNPADLAFVSDEHGMMSDGYCFAGRLDYALAANLNIWGSYIWAHRVERAGFYNGQIIDTGLGQQSSANPPGPLTAAQGALLARYGGTTPYCPDGFIGWEVNAGFDWKLLEGVTLKTRYAFWQPGHWFDYAYQAWGVFGGTVQDSCIVQGRSAINAFQTSIQANF